jgi:hypothetical protein
LSARRRAAAAARAHDPERAVSARRRGGAGRGGAGRAGGRVVAQLQCGCAWERAGTMLCVPTWLDCITRRRVQVKVRVHYKEASAGEHRTLLDTVRSAKSINWSYREKTRKWPTAARVAGHEWQGTSGRAHGCTAYMRGGRASCVRVCVCVCHGPAADWNGHGRHTTTPTPRKALAHCASTHAPRLIAHTAGARA